MALDGSRDPFALAGQPPDHAQANRGRARLPQRKRVLVRYLVGLRNRLLGLRLWVLRRYLGMDLSPGCRISLKANLDKTNPRGVHVADGTYVAFGAVILAHDMSRAMHCDTYIGANCFVGAHAIVMPGVRIGDECIVGSGSVVTRDVPSNSIVAGNPAEIVRSGIQTERWGILAEHARAAFEEGETLRRSGWKG